ncbi:MAG: Omp28-related outer membrane protein [Crocinitomicaceae bacterium]|nr:Omp28-related outer membrane protein [Crocinitomicaceae bacterium]
MRKIYLLVFLGAALGFASCDHVEFPYPETIATLGWEGYPDGDSAHYVANAWPVFSANPNTQRNILIEDFTGHLCSWCPPAADTAHSLHGDFPSRIYIATIHAGPNGLDVFQSTNPNFPIDWTNPEGLAIGKHFGDLPGSGFIGNPRGSVSRIEVGGQHTLDQDTWRGTAVTGMAVPLKVNIQSATNYYPSTRGLFLHTQLEVMDGGLNLDDLYTVAYLIEDSLVAKQKMPDNTTNETYVHRDIMRGCINTTWEGMKITDAYLIDGDTYDFFYRYELPAEYNAEDVHLLIYVRNKTTEEIYHVVKQDLQ